MSSEERARQMVAKACHWVRLHPDKWQKLKDFCGYLMEEGDLIQRGNVYELARRYGMDVRLASEFKRDHNLWSVLTCYMVMERWAATYLKRKVKAAQKRKERIQKKVNDNIRRKQHE